jgi:CubicO group peptidase (beta-lactamase class C family)
LGINKINIIKNFIFYIFFIIVISNPSYSQQSLFSQTGPNAKSFGEDNNYGDCRDAFGHWKKSECRIFNLSQTVKTLDYAPSRSIVPSADPLNLNFMKNPPTELIQKVDTYISKHPAMGLLVIKNGEIVVERYQYGRKSDMIFRGFSMSKTFTAMLVGIAHQKGFIKSLDDKVSVYWSEIKDSPYGDATIKELLRMASGVESGGYEAGNSTIWAVLFKRENLSQPSKFNEYLNNIKSNGVKGKFRYSDPDTEVLSRVLVKATNKNITTLTSEWLWQPMGGRGVGKWLYSSTDNIETGAGGLIASLNDYGRFGVLLANDGKYKNNQVIPLNFLIDATDIKKTPQSHIGLNSSNAFQYGYGYQTWIQPNKERTFCALGHFGQIICVQPSSKIVMVQVAAEGHDAWRNSFGSMGGALNSLWENVLKDLGGSVE